MKDGNKVRLVSNIVSGIDPVKKLVFEIKSWVMSFLHENNNGSTFDSILPRPYTSFEL